MSIAAAPAGGQHERGGGGSAGTVLSAAAAIDAFCAAGTLHGAGSTRAATTTWVHFDHVRACLSSGGVVSRDSTALRHPGYAQSLPGRVPVSIVRVSSHSTHRRQRQLPNVAYES